MNTDVPGFAGRIGAKPEPAGADKALLAFLDKNLGQVVQLDITLSPALAEEMVENVYRADDGKTRYSFGILNNWQQWREGGTEITIHVPPGETLAFDAGAARRLAGTFEVADYIGPHQGFFTFVLAPVNPVQ